MTLSATAKRALIEEARQAAFYYSVTDISPRLVTRLADALEASLPRTIETDWYAGCPNDGMYEYTESSDCDGTFIARFRRTPAAHIDAGPWEKTTEPMPPFEPREEDRA